MQPRFRRLLGSVLAAAALAAAPAPARAQEKPSDFETWHVPGWTFTPGMILGALYDSNVTLLSPGPGQKAPSDKLVGFEPFGQLEFYGPRTTLSGGYHGMMRRYLELDALDSTDHRAFLTLRTRVSRRLTVFLSDNFAQVPSTDRLELNGVPFEQSAARYNDSAAGFEARLSRTNDLAMRYEMTWVDFMRKDTLLTGGIVNGLHSTLSHRFTDRVSFGGEYEVRFANLNEGTRQQLFQDAGAMVRYRGGEDTTFEAAGGLAYLYDQLSGATRTGPYVRAEIVHRARRATIGGEFHRSYVPSVAFGGTNQTEAARAYVQMPLNHNRLYLQESATWNHTEPFDPRVLPLQSTWLNTVLGYSIQRWFRIEGYHALTRQDTHLAGGRINRQVAGVQFVISEPMRIR